VQIGGGVRVATLSKRLSEQRPVAIWATEFCVEISQAGRASFARSRRKYEQKKYRQTLEDEAGETG
jgi:hypothetical protein